MRELNMKFTKAFYHASSHYLVSRSPGKRVFYWIGPQARLQEDKEYRVTILHTNDAQVASGKQQRRIRHGPARKTLIGQHPWRSRTNDGSSLLLSRWRHQHRRSRVWSQTLKTRLSRMNMLKYDAMAIGRSRIHNPLSVLKKQKEWPVFSFLICPNILDAKTGNHCLKRNRFSSKWP